MQHPFDKGQRAFLCTISRNFKVIYEKFTISKVLSFLDITDHFTLFDCKPEQSKFHPIKHNSAFPNFLEDVASRLNNKFVSGEVIDYADAFIPPTVPPWWGMILAIS